MRKNKISAKLEFEISDLESAFSEYFNLVRKDVRCRLILSLHDYSKGIWIELKNKKLSKEDFCLRDNLNKFDYEIINY